MALAPLALDALYKTSRTFFVPISRLPDGLQEAIGGAYLSMRAIDEIEDHPQLSTLSKQELLHGISGVLQAQTRVAEFDYAALERLFEPYGDVLAEVTLRLGEWACTPSPLIAPRLWEATAATADRMAYWVNAGWRIRDERDLNHYTFSVAGSVGILICDLWAWFDGRQLARAPAIEFGRGLQATNILRNRSDDLARGVDFFPSGWDAAHVSAYARRHLESAEAYARDLPSDAFKYLIELPLALAYATLDSIARGETKLSRRAVQELFARLEQIPG